MKKLILLLILAGCADDVSNPPDALPSCEDLGYMGGPLLCNSDGSYCIYEEMPCQLSP